MSLIGSLDQFKLSSVLSRIESHTKTGLLVVRQGGTGVEFYFREGLLMCIGPIRTNAHLCERLLQDGIISQQALQETMRRLASTPPSENRIALALMELGLVTQETFRSWATRKTLDVLQVLVTWTSGNIYFEDDVTPPEDRLLIALSVTSLLAMLPPMSQPLQSSQSSSFSLTGMPTKEAQSILPSTPKPDIARIPTLMNAAQFLAEQQVNTSSSHSLSTFSQNPVQSPSSQSLFTKDLLPGSMEAQSLIDAQSFSPSTSQPLQESPSLSIKSLIDEDAFTPPVSSQPLFSSEVPIMPMSESSSSLVSSSPTTGSLFSTSQHDNASASFFPPQPVTTPLPRRYVDTSYMRPDMVMIPLDLSSSYDQQSPVLLTPDQWRLLTKVDGQTTLYMACQELSMRPEVVCQLAGELVADHIIQLVLPGVEPTNELSPTSREYVASGLSNGYVAPGSAATTAQPWAAPVPPSLPDVAAQFPSSISFETQSQWGNGGNGASFIPGRGWVANLQQAQPMSPTTSSTQYSGSYAHVGGNRR